MRAKDTIVYDFYCNTMEQCGGSGMFGFRPPLKIEKIIVNICPLFGFKHTFIAKF